QVLVTKELTDEVTHYLSNNGSLLANVKWLTNGTGLVVLGTLLESTGQYVTLLLRQKSQYKMEQMLMKKAISLPLTKFQQPEYYDLLQRAKSNVAYRGFQLIEHTFSIGQSLLSIISLFIVLWQFEWILAVA